MLRPWLLMGLTFKHERIGQSVVTAEISVLSGTTAKSAYAATFIFFLAALAMCLYFLLREIGVDYFTGRVGRVPPRHFSGDHAPFSVRVSVADGRALRFCLLRDAAAPTGSEWAQFHGFLRSRPCLLDRRVF